MAIGTLPVVTRSLDGVDVTGQTPTATDGDAFVWDTNTTLLVDNDSGGSINVTVKARQTLDGLTIGDKVVAVGAGVKKEIGPIPEFPFKQTSDGKCLVICSATSSVKIAAVKRG